VKIKIYKSTILTVVLYVCDIWSLILKEHTLNIFEKRVSRMFGAKRDEVMEVGENCTMRSFIASPNIIRMINSRSMRWAGHVAHMGAKMNAYRVLVGKPEKKRDH
jgi:hypothetical protein